MNQASALLRTVQGGWTAHDRSFGRELFRHGETASTGPEAEAAEE